MEQQIKTAMGNKKLMRVAYRAALKFKKWLTLDEIDNCVINALWKGLETYNPTSSAFSSYLYRGVTFECMNYRKTCVLARQFPRGKRDLTYIDSEAINTFDDIDMIDEIGICPNPELVYNRFYKSMTIQEIATEKGVSRECIRGKIKKSLEILGNRIVEGV